MSCKNEKKYLDAYVDGELEPGLMLDIERHLETCESCQALVLLKRKLKSGIARLGEIKAPDHLRQRIVALSSGRYKARRIAAVAALPLAAAASLLFVLGTPSSGAPEAPLAELVGDVVARHAHALPMEVRGDPDQASSWFRGKVDFPVRAPSLGLQQASFQGARLSNVREHQAAHMAYTVDGHRVTLMIFNRSNTAFSGGRHVKVNGRDVLLGRKNGFNVAVILDGDMAYALSSDLPQDRLLSLAKYIGG
jgi:anti-sigma factor RsiW